VIRVFAQQGNLPESKSLYRLKSSKQKSWLTHVAQPDRVRLAIKD